MFFTEEDYNKHSVLQKRFSLQLKEKDKELNISQNLCSPQSNQISREDVQQLLTTLEVPSSRNTQEIEPEQINKTYEDNKEIVKVKEEPDYDVHSEPPEMSAYTHIVRVPYPRESFLTPEQHRKYLELSEIYSKPTPQTIQNQEFTYFKELQIKVLQEQEEFMHFSKFVAEQNRIFYGNLHPSVIKYMEAHIDQQRKRVNSYPQYFIHHDIIPLPSIHTQFKSEVPFNLLQTLLQLGDVPRVLLPNMNQKPAPLLPFDFQKIRKQFPPNRSPSSKDTEAYSKQVCSEDANAVRLADKYQTEVVISSSGLQCLLDNVPPSYERHWQLPVTVKKITTESGEQRRVVFIDKPFPQLNMHPRTLNNWFHKFSFKTAVVRPRDKKIHSFKDMDHANIESFVEDHLESREVAASDANDLFDVGDQDNLETFGTENHSFMKKSKEADTSPKKTGITNADTEFRIKEEISIQSNAENSEVDITPSAQVTDVTESKSDIPNCETVKGTVDSHEMSSISNDGEKHHEGNKQAELKGNLNIVTGGSSNSDTDVSMDKGDPRLNVESHSDSDALVIDLPNSSVDSVQQNTSIESIASPIRSPISSLSPIRSPKCIIPLSPFKKADTLHVSKESANTTETENVQSKEIEETTNIITRMSLRSRKSDSCLETAKPTPDTKKKISTKRHSTDSTQSPIPSKRLTRSQSKKSETSDKDESENEQIEKGENNATLSIEIKENITEDCKLDQESIFDKSKDADDISADTGGLSMFDQIFHQQSKMLGKSPSRPKSQVIEKAEPAAKAVETSCKKSAEDQFKPMESASDYLEPDNHNVTYNLWKLGNLKLLIRCSISGQTRNTKGEAQFVHLVAKPEYQSNFGAEQLTNSEVAKAWAATIIRPKCTLIRARAVCHTGKLMLLEHLQPNQVVPPRSAFRPHVALHILHDVLHKLYSLNPGVYLLSYTPGSPHFNIKKNVNNRRGSYDLHKAYTSDIPILGSHDVIPWIPLDPAILLHWHKVTGRIPATFEPKRGNKQNFKMKKKKQKGKKNKGKQGDQVQVIKEDPQKSVECIAEVSASYKTFIPSSTNENLPDNH